MGRGGGGGQRADGAGERHLQADVRASGGGQVLGQSTELAREVGDEAEAEAVRGLRVEVGREAAAVVGHVQEEDAPVGA
jgi:hypothetical protein